MGHFTTKNIPFIVHSVYSTRLFFNINHVGFLPVPPNISKSEFERLLEKIEKTLQDDLSEK